MKKMLSVFIVLFLSLIFTGGVFAEEDIVILSEDEEGLFLHDGDVVTAVYEVIDGEWTELTVDEYLDIVEESAEEGFEATYEKERSLQTTPFAPGEVGILNTGGGMTNDTYKYKRSSYTIGVLRTSLLTRVSPVDYNGTSRKTSLKFQISKTQKQSFSISLKSAEASKVRANAGFTWFNERSVSTTRELEMNPKEYGWFEMAPYMNKTTGYVERYNWKGQYQDKRFVTAYSPKSVSGTLDGVYYAKTSKTRP
ncbi:MULTISPECIES: hypothetical protein [Bacillaceae]|uniref:Uncharacterized protein n=1 Tax=Evansella alkalicola TaxID=745819 RepID=A0ABS6JY26_9BACI|nr:MULTISPECIES: hypothetical protein [Bacillaceae]MBU9723504.1 hypothetical protein [Bacillus alkalicola]